jgi:hypothetical protein
MIPIRRANFEEAPHQQTLITHEVICRRGTMLQVNPSTTDVAAVDATS